MFTLIDEFCPPPPKKKSHTYSEGQAHYLVHFCTPPSTVRMAPTLMKNWGSAALGQEIHAWLASPYHGFRLLYEGLRQHLGGSSSWGSKEPLLQTCLCGTQSPHELKNPSPDDVQGWQCWKNKNIPRGWWTIYSIWVCNTPNKNQN